MRSTARPMRSSLLRHKSDTVDLLKTCFSVIDQPLCGLPERQRARGTRHFLKLSCRRAGDDQLAQLVVQDQELADRLAAAEAGAAAMRAALALAARAEHAHQPLRQHR